MKNSKIVKPISLFLILVSVCTPCLAARKPYILPPDIIGDSARSESPHNGSHLGIPPKQLKWMQSHPYKNVERPIDPAAAAFFPKEAQLNNSLKQWYHSHLSAMGEKSFRSLSKKDTVYRFLWLRSFHHPISVSIKILNHGNGGAILHAVELDGADTYGAPKGKQLRSFSYRYFPKLTKELIAKIETSNFWTIPTNDDFVQPSEIPDELRKTPLGNSGNIGSRFKFVPILYRFDGAQWVMEGWKEGKYRLVRRCSPREGSFRELCVIFLLLSHLYPTKPQEIY